MAARQHAADGDVPPGHPLQAWCDDRLITAPADSILVDLQRSIGAHLALVGTNEYLFDAGLRVAGNPLGFSANPLFAACQHLESWTGDYRTKNVQAIAGAFRELLSRLSGGSSYNHHVHFCASGSEAVGISLGLCFANRSRPHAHRVLAFEGSSHGGTLVALSAGADRQQREHNPWPGCEAVLAPYPEIQIGDVDPPPFGSEWLRHWSQRAPPAINDPRWEQMLGSEADEQAIALLHAEIESLTVVREILESDEIFAILAEPMQCERGDRYSSSRFHHGLCALANAYGVPVVYDEVQTGFHVGRRFFWHQQFSLRDADDQPCSPEVIACGQPGQVGIVISRRPVPHHESFCPASLIRGYVTASIIEQFATRISVIEQQVRERLTAAVHDYQPAIGHPRSQGTAFAFDFEDPQGLRTFVKSCQDAGILLRPAGDRTARFRLLLSSSEAEIERLWMKLNRCLESVVAGTAISDDPLPGDAAGEPSIEPNALSFDFQLNLADSKLATITEFDPKTRDIGNYLKAQLRNLPGADQMDFIQLNSANYPDYRASILQMQQEVYEPVRQSPPEAFDRLFESEHPIESPALLLMTGQRIVAMAFCGPLSCFQQERGVSDDPYLNDERTFYMLDLTVAPEFRGKGLGRVMKNAIALLAINRGVNAIHGRNRDRLARAMWAINLSLGSFEQRHLFDDYPDNKPHRDCLYYRCPLQWQVGAPRPALTFPGLDAGRLNREYLARNLPALVNPIGFPGFVTENFVDDLLTVSQTLPAELRHLYLANSLSEAMDKLVQAIRSERKSATRLLTLRGHRFGVGTFLTRTLSGVGDPYFEVARMEPDRVIDDLPSQLEADDCLAVFVETNRMRDREELLRQCVAICRDQGVPVVFNETSARFGTSAQLSRQPELMPDAGVAWLGGSTALAYLRDCFFVDDPLSLTGNWNGDGYALARFAETMRQQRTNAKTN